MHYNLSCKLLHFATFKKNCCHAILIEKKRELKKIHNMKVGNFRFHATEDVREGYQKNLHKICKNVKIHPKHKKKKKKK
jgi:hypothetical protein